jgi:hypothetical protein
MKPIKEIRKMLDEYHECNDESELAYMNFTTQAPEILSKLCDRFESLREDCNKINDRLVMLHDIKTLKNCVGQLSSENRGIRMQIKALHKLVIEAANCCRCEGSLSPLGVCDEHVEELIKLGYSEESKSISKKMEE